MTSVAVQVVRTADPATSDDQQGKSEPVLRIALLTGGDDKSYAVGLATALSANGVGVDFIGSDSLDCPELRQEPLVRFLNLRGDQSERAGAIQKVSRIAVYYARLLKYAVTANPVLFHVLWNNKFEYIDRTLLMLIYRASGRRLTLTAHNVNAARRDGRDSVLNRLTLRVQYALCDAVFVHSDRLKQDLSQQFSVEQSRVKVIPFGLNVTTPSTALSAEQARDRLEIQPQDRVILCFGQIAPYKGLEYLVAAVDLLARENFPVKVVIAGKVKRGHETYWADVDRSIIASQAAGWVSRHIRFVPDDEVEVFFKAADVVALPYTNIFQSGVPFLAYAYGIPVVATDVGSLRDDVVDGVTGYVCKPRDPVSLAQTLRRHFDSDLFSERSSRRALIRQFAEERHSWARVAAITIAAYSESPGVMTPRSGQWSWRR